MLLLSLLLLSSPLRTCLLAKRTMTPESKSAITQMQDVCFGIIYFIIEDKAKVV